MQIRPRAVLLDLDDTIVDDTSGAESGWIDACNDCCSHLPVSSATALLNQIHQTREWYWSDPERQRLGRLNLDATRREIVALAFRELGLEDDGLSAQIGDRYSCRRDACLSLVAGAVETLHWLRECRCRLALLTNGASVAQRKKIDRFGLAPLFETILVEGELGFGKPDPRIYQLALERLKMATADACMIGDNLEFDVAQPQRLGIRGVWIDLKGAGVPSGASVQPDLVVGSLRELRHVEW